MNLLVLMIIPAIVSFFVMRNVKATVPEEQVDESQLSGRIFWYVFILCLLAPLIAQTIFYYGWKKQLPKKAKKARDLGWLSVLLWILLWIGVIYFVFGPLVDLFKGSVLYYEIGRLS